MSLNTETIFFRIYTLCKNIFNIEGRYNFRKEKDKLKKQESIASDYEKIKAFPSQVEAAIDDISILGRYLAQNKPVINQNTYQISEKQKDFDGALNSIKNLEEIISEIAGNYAEFAGKINNISEFTDSVGSLNEGLRGHIEKESFDRLIDFKHKVNLTILRVFQIFIFVFATYAAVSSATWVLTKLQLSSSLVIPRGLISIVPSSLEQRAQSLAIIENATTEEKPSKRVPALDSNTIVNKGN